MKYDINLDIEDVLNFQYKFIKKMKQDKIKKHTK